MVVKKTLYLAHHKFFDGDIELAVQERTDTPSPFVRQSDYPTDKIIEFSEPYLGDVTVGNFQSINGAPPLKQDEPTDEQFWRMLGEKITGTNGTSSLLSDFTDGRVTDLVALGAALSEMKEWSRSNPGTQAGRIIPHFIPDGFNVLNQSDETLKEIEKMPIQVFKFSDDYSQSYSVPKYPPSARKYLTGMKIPSQ